MGYVQTRVRHAQWWAAGVALVLAGAALAGFELGRRSWLSPVAAVPAAPVAVSDVPARVASPGPTPAPAPVAPLARNVDVTRGDFVYARTTGSVLGSAGALQRFRVAVEGGTAQAAASFADAVDKVLGDRRSWIGSGRLRLQRVPAAAPAEFTVYLATPATSQAMCAEAGLQTRGYSSCRTPGRVIINAARWASAVPDYGADLATYRTYVVNHEVGHQLGHKHQYCPGPGQRAPVMQQQTLGLQGCVANAWPYP